MISSRLRAPSPAASARALAVAGTRSDAPADDGTDAAATAPDTEADDRDVSPGRCALLWYEGCEEWPVWDKYIGRELEGGTGADARPDGAGDSEAA